MKKKSFLSLALMAVLLGSCGRGGDTSSVSTGSAVLPGSSSSLKGSSESTKSISSSSSIISSIRTSSSSSSISIPTPDELAEIYRKTIEADYSNLTLESYTIVNEEVEESSLMYLVDGYTIISGDTAADNLFYHDYQNESHLYFGNTYGNGDGWLKEGYQNAKLGLENIYFSVPYALRELAEIDISNYDYYADEYGNHELLVNDSDVVERLNMGILETYFQINVVAILFVIQDYHITEIIGAESMTDFISISLYDFGETRFTGTLPPAPNADNVREYYEDWTDLPKWYDIRLTSIIISFPAGKEDGVIEYEEQVKINSALNPTDATVYYLEWFISDSSVISLSGNTVKGIKVGTATIYCRDYYTGVQSNVLTVTVNPVVKPILEGKLYDFTFTAITDGIVAATNSVVGSTPAELSAEGGISILKSNKNNDGDELKWKIGTDVMVFTLGSGFVSTAMLTMDFKGQEVSGISFDYSLFWSNDAGNISKITEFKIQTSNDGLAWVDAVDLLPKFKQSTTAMSITPVVEEFALARMIRILVKTGSVGNQVRIGMSSIQVYADENCKPAPVEFADDMLDKWVGEDISGSDLELVINKSTASLKSEDYGNFELELISYKKSTNTYILSDGTHDVEIEYDTDNDSIDVTFEYMGIYTSSSGLKRYVAPVITITSVVLSLDQGSSSKLKVGETASVSVVVLPADTPDKSVTYSSSNTNVITVDEDGLVTAIGTGTATITATAKVGGMKSTALTFTVTSDSDVLSGDIVGTWEGVDLSTFIDYEAKISADGKLVLKDMFDGYAYNFTLFSQNSGTYVFKNDLTGSELIITYCSTCEGYSLEWIEEGINISEDYYCLVKQ